MPKPFTFPSFVYVVTLDLTDASVLLAQAEAALTSGVRILQYRDKTSSMAEKLYRGRALKALCLRHGARLIVNDDLVLALAIDADGVHLGSDDGRIRDARRLLPLHYIVGASCYNDLRLAHRAIANGASYVAFGACFDSPTKPAARRISLEQLREFRTTLGPEVAICGIGGITHDNVAQLGDNVDAVAVISELFGTPGQPAPPEQVHVRVQQFLNESVIV